MSTLFDAAFRELLRDVVARVREVRAREDERAHVRRRVRGQSGTFAGHQRYVAGDDLRRVDWNVYARSGELFVKLVEEEQRRAITVLLDTSASMATGRAPRFDGARRFVALLGALALARLGGFRLHAGGQLRFYQRLGQLDALLRDLAALQASDRNQEAAMTRWGAERGRGGGGRMIWVSDFVRLDEVERGLRRLAPLRRQLLGLWPRTSDDRGVDVGGRVELDDPESGSRLALRVDAALRRALGRELARLDQRRADVFARAGVPLVPFDLPADGDAHASAWLAGGWLARV